jgi:hypothetical protein
MKFNYSVHKFSILNQMNPNDILTPYFIMNNFNIILPPAPVYCICSLFNNA